MPGDIDFPETGEATRREGRPYNLIEQRFKITDCPNMA
jgi:hypothetical protein